MLQTKIQLLKTLCLKNSIIKVFTYFFFFLFSGFNTVLLGGLIVCEIHQRLGEETPIALTLQDKGFSSLRKGLGWGRVGHFGFGFIFPSSFALFTFLFSLRKYQRTHTHGNKNSKISLQPLHSQALPQTVPGMGGVR